MFFWKIDSFESVIKKLLYVLVVSVISIACTNNSVKNKNHLLFVISQGDLNQTKQLIESGVDINYKNTPLQNGTLHACLLSKNDDNAMLTYLLNNGADVNMQNSEGSTPLKFAIVIRQIECLKTLLASGADTNIKDRYGLKAIDYLDMEKDTVICKLMNCK